MSSEESTGSDSNGMDHDSSAPVNLTQNVWQIYTPSRSKRPNPDVLDPDANRRVRQKTASCDSNTSVYTVPTKNQFSALDIEGTTENNEETFPKTTVPPIFVPNVNNVPAMIKFLKEALKTEDFEIKSLANDKIKITPKTPNTYREIIKHLSANSHVYYTYQLKQERAYRVVLRHIHHTVDVKDIKAALLEKDHKVRNIINVRHRLTKSPLPLFFVDLEPKPNNKEVFKINRLLNCVVAFEPPRLKREIVQCKNCQRYEHTRSYCAYPYRCVKCGKEHDPDKCLKEKQSQPTCALCEGNHPANYKGCKVYQEILKRKGYNNSSKHRMFQQEMHVQTQNRNIETTYSHENSRSGHVNAGTWADVARSKPVERHQHNDDSNSIMKIIQHSFERFENILMQQSQQINSLINLITSLVSKLSNA